MKTPLSTLVAIAAATPVFAHADGSLHSHGAELFLAIAAIGVIGALMYRS
ncbi:hypothetical protein Q5Y75_08790 [Ruegeria sp. 2205SS24-7]|nr:hypothetical protein [Ruegeria sp. 2205SS24-7]MDP5217309.1 hypothetical protein [Ruegeria sp. 2205SS24-7]